MMYVMKKICVLLSLLLLMFTSGCEQMVSELDAGNLPATPDLSADTMETNPSNVNEGNSTSEFNYKNESFLGLSLFHIHNHWIYYNGYRSDLRKCKIDLSQDDLVFSGDEIGSIGSEFIVNPEGYCIAKKTLQYESFPVDNPNHIPDIVEWTIINIYDGSVELIDLPSTGQNFKNIVLYKNMIILIDQNKERRIDMYNRKGDFIKTVYSEDVLSFGIIEDSLFFLPAYSDTNQENPGNVIMRYDLNRDKTEIAFEFDLKEQPLYGVVYWPEARYCGRNIIVKNNTTSIVFTSIDDIDPLEVEFNTTSSPWDSVSFINGIGDEMYFRYYHGDKRDSESETFGEYQYFTLNQDVIKSISNRIDPNDHSCLFVMDGYIYYIEEYKMARENLL